MVDDRGGIYRDIKFDADEMVWKYLSHGPFSNTSEFKAHYCDQSKPDTRHFVLVSHPPISLSLSYVPTWCRSAHFAYLTKRYILCRQIAEAANPSGCCR